MAQNKFLPGKAELPAVRPRVVGHTGVAKVRFAAFARDQKGNPLHPAPAGGDPAGELQPDGTADAVLSFLPACGSGTRQKRCRAVGASPAIIPTPEAQGLLIHKHRN